ncbi:MAG: 4-alpha-glucanotransferase [Elusimicrobiota bacterium]
MSKAFVSPRRRASGVLLHLTSLPKPGLGPDASRFARFLQDAGQSWWQMLPVNPTLPGGSPYDAYSAFAGDPRLLGVSVRAPARGELARFLKANAHWLDDFALFVALKRAWGGASWRRWPRGLRLHEAAALCDARVRYQSSIDAIVRAQWAFAYKWAQFKRDCNQRGIRLIGDIPFYVAYESADVWANQRFFMLGRDGKAEAVSGVPPDYFSAKGQMWGNPLYRWTALKREAYPWWTQRLRRALSMFDALRLDHFIGFERYWSVPAGARDARGGRFVKGPGAGFFRALSRDLGPATLIAEDLGILTARVHALRERFGLPGMKVLQFEIAERAALMPGALPSLPVDCFAYTGTHDNDTIASWLSSRGAGGLTHWDAIEALYRSEARNVIIPLQDILGLHSDARMNTPGTTKGNWRWKFAWRAIKPSLARRLQMLGRVNRRCR